MKLFDVVLTKSYLLRIKAEDEMQAREFSEYFTNDIQDISSTQDRENNNFQIEDIKCKSNQTYEIIEISESN